MTAIAGPKTVAPWIRKLGAVGLAAFAVFMLVVLVMVFLDPAARSVVPIYREGTLGWWRGEDIFGTGTAGFIYLPSFAVLYTPFALLGPQLGDMAWRAVSAFLLCYSMSEALRVGLPRFDARTRLLILGTALLIAVPGAANALRNGQATTILYALMLWATVEAIEERWWRAGLLLALAFALKPLAIVYMLLIAVARPKVAVPMLVCLAVLLALPLAHPDPARALELYGLGIHKVLAAGDPEIGRWTDFTGLLGKFGIRFSETVLTVIRLVAALATLALGLVALRRNGNVRGMLNLYALAVVYLLLMNPRAEAQTYLMFTATVAITSVLYWHQDGRQKAAVALIPLAVFVAHGALGTAVMRATDVWLDPLLCLLYLPFLIADCLRRAPSGGR